jgi:hypothetical protein
MSALVRLDEGAGFGEGLKPCGCAACQRAFFAPQDRIGQPCPWCAGAPLVPQPAMVREAPPERIVPFSSGRRDLMPALTRFCAVRLRTSDLTAEHLAERATAIWFPMWLVDATGVGTWSAEVGFDYQVQSHEEQLQGGSWRTVEVMRTQIRWEPRLGSVERAYANVPTPALTEHAALIEALGRYDLDRSVDFTPDKVAGGLLRLPDVHPADAWPEAEDALGHAVAEDCAKAAGAQHVRNVHATVSWEEPHWTWMLLPVYASWYADDAGEKHVVYVNGQTGLVVGPTYASMRKAWLWAAILGGLGVASTVGAGLLAIVGLAIWPLLAVAAIVGVIAAAFFLAALAPPLWVWSHNRAQRIALAGATR